MRWRSARSTARSPFAEQVDTAPGVLAELDDVAGELRAAGERIDESPERLAEIRERRQLLKNLRRKYGDDLAAVMTFHAESAERGSPSSSSSTSVPPTRPGSARTHWRPNDVAAEAVGRRRREVGPLLASAVETELRALGDAPRVDRRRGR